MKSKKSFFSNLVVLVVALSIPATVFILKSGNLDFRFSALDSDIPENVVIANVNSNSLIVNWVTEKPVTGGVKLNGGAVLPILENKSSSYHEVEIKNLEAGKVYQFSLYSDGIEFTNNGQFYSGQTATKSINEAGNYFVYGQVFSTDGITFQQGGQITLQLRKDNQKSQIIAGTINEAGGYQLNLKNLLDENLVNTYPYFGSLDVIFTVFTNASTEPITRIFTVNLDYARQLPNLYLGDVTINTIPGVEGL
ncbi:MAG: hypothetical protein WCJ58_04740 [bacterium]